MGLCLKATQKLQNNMSGVGYEARLSKIGKTRLIYYSTIYVVVVNALKN